MSVVPRRIFHINDQSSNIQDTQLCFETLEDSDLEFRMWCGKDDEGTVTKWLAKGQKGLLSILELTTGAHFGDEPTDASWASGTVTVNFATGKPYQIVTVDGDVTTFSITPPLGCTSIYLSVRASGADCSLSGFTNFHWFNIDPDVDTVTVASGGRAAITAMYLGASEGWEASIVWDEA